VKKQIKKKIERTEIHEDKSDNDNNHCEVILIKQDNSCQTHTGGIVWETSYLLATYLLSCAEDNSQEDNGTSNKQKNNFIVNKRLGKTLEVGSGCGMLGLILASSGLCNEVIMTETKDVMSNLLENVEYNVNSSVSVRQLRWDALKEDIHACQHDMNSDDLNPHTFDTIVGTDVIFSPSLVKPLLKTLRKMSHEQTNIFLCVQIRCEDSHTLFLKKAAKYDLLCVDITEKLNEFPSCSFGLELDCKLLHLSVNKNITSKERKRKHVTISGETGINSKRR
jgi:predicted nicotinamide N-methyase